MEDLQSKLKDMPLAEIKRLLKSLKQKKNFGSFLEFLPLLGYTVPALYEVWAKLLEKPRLVIESARDHGKTTFFSIAYPLFKIATTPNYHVCIISFSEPQSRRILREIKVLLETIPAFQDMIPTKWKPGSWGKTEVHTLNRSYIQAKSFGTSIRGGHYDLVIIDDPLKDRSTMPTEEQEEHFYSVIVPAVKPNGQLIVVGTPLRYGDLFDSLQTNKNYEHYKFPAIKEDGTALRPDRYDMAKLEWKKSEMKHFWMFAREFLLERIDPEGAPFKQEWFKYYDTLPRKLNTIISVDPAITFQGDFTGIVLTGTDEDNNTYVMATRKTRTANINEIVDTVFNLAEQYGCKHVIIESLGFQRLFKFWMYKEMEKRDYYFSIEEIKSHSASKEQRIMSLQPKIEMGKLLFKIGQLELMEEFMRFPKGTHDDLIDSLSMQVGRWRAADKDRLQQSPEGSWDNTFKAHLERSTQGWEKELFRDMGDGDTPSNIISKN